jgi:hypothetical protein
MAEPNTSCMSAPMMAISAIIHKKIDWNGVKCFLHNLAKSLLLNNPILIA